ncbi:MAG: M48 family metallopeptidase [Planctomycetota bacterium]
MAILLAAGCHAGERGRIGLSVADVSEAEALAGAWAAPGLEHRYGGIVSIPQAETRMRRIGTQLAGVEGRLEGDYKFAILASEAPNAFSLPGGRIYVTRGLYECLDDDRTLAAVLAHEMAHIEAKDSLKPRCRDRDEALQREIAADLRGCAFLMNAGYEAADLVALVNQLDDAMPTGWSDARCRSLCAAHPEAAGASLGIRKRIAESIGGHIWASITPPGKWLLLALQVRLSVC